jgi:hypothetical protein
VSTIKEDTVAAFTLFAIYYYQGDFRIMEFHKEKRGPKMAWEHEDKADIIWKSVDLDWCLEFVSACQKGGLDPYIYRERFVKR